MEERGLWELFYATGAPEVWLAIRQAQSDGAGEEAQPACSPETGLPQQI